MARSSAARAARTSEPWFEIRRSTIHGRGAFALRRIPKGTRIVEYTGPRMTNAEADTRYDDRMRIRPYPFLFIVDNKTVVDGGRRSNIARFINHSCDPNCSSVIEDGRIYIEAIRDIPPGAELTYDYHLNLAGRWQAEWEQRYACHCGARTCRGTMLDRRPPKSKRRRTEG